RPGQFGRTPGRRARPGDRAQRHGPRRAGARHPQRGGHRLPPPSRPRRAVTRLLAVVRPEIQARLNGGLGSRPDVEVAWGAAAGEDVERLATLFLPDVVLLDLGVHALERTRTGPPTRAGAVDLIGGPPAVVLLERVDARGRATARRVGALGVLPASASGHEML